MHDENLRSSFLKRYNLHDSQIVKINLEREFSFLESENKTSEKELCKMATISKDGKTLWNLSNKFKLAAYALAKKKGMNCGTKLFMDVHDYESICDKATTLSGNWTKDKDLVSFVQEAKNLQLDCYTLSKLF